MKLESKGIILTLLIRSFHSILCSPAAANTKALYTPVGSSNFRSLVFKLPRFTLLRYDFKYVAGKIKFINSSLSINIHLNINVELKSS